MAQVARLTDNLAAVRDKIAQAARRGGRTSNEITLVAVTKYVDLDIASQLIAAGCRDLGESRPQELWSKAESFGQTTSRLAPDAPVGAESPVRWHLIGHLQRNKIDRTLPLASLIHSGDSLRSLEAIDQTASKSERRVPVLIEINISGDATKHGFQPAEVAPNLTSMAALASLQIRGLMCMASREGDLSQARREFASLRQLRDQLRSIAPPNIDLRELSMGMSGDFEVAIEEGATMVRIGSALFEGISLR
jgi:PLP dependent protein